MGGFGQRILLAEDDRFLRKSAGAMLHRQGFIVMAAEDGEEALRLARTDGPDLILLDVIMPKMQGFDVLRALKSDPHTSPIPVIILSNLDQESDSVAAREMGALDYWVKSNLALDELAMRIGQAISTSRPDHNFEARVNALTRAALDPVVMMDAEGRITDWNRQAEITFGWSREEAMGRLLSDTIIPLRYQEAHTRGLRCFLETRGKEILNRRMEIEAVHRDGREFPVDLAISAVHSGAVWTFVAFVRDISPRKRVEEALAEETEALYSLMDNTQDGIYFKDVAGRFTRINGAHARTLGISNPLQALGKTDADFFDRDFAQAAQADEQQIMQSGTSLIGKVECVRPNGGTEIWYSTTKVVLKDSQQRIAGILGVSRDITQLNRLQKELQASNEELEQRVVERTNQLLRASEALREAQAELAHVNRVTTMGELAASISHEIMQPITSLMANAQAALQFLNSEPPDLKDVGEALGCAVDDGNRASDLISRIRAFFKKTPPRLDAVDVNAAILEVIALTHGEAVKNGASVHTQLADGLPLIHADRVQLQQVILNLMINALEAMSGVSEGSRELLISSGRNASGGVLVDVQDSGPGLTPEDFNHLFDAFYTTKTGGIGMGLSICRSIVEQHGGRIWPSHDAGRGASILFTLPVEGPPQPSQGI